MDDARTRRAGDPPGDRVPDSDAAKEELVDETIDGSFPASDPPSTWARETTEDAGAGHADAGEAPGGAEDAPAGADEAPRGADDRRDG
jgi:hypothetical protein